MASLGAEQQISSNSQTAEPVQRGESREGSVERKATATVARRTCATPVSAVAIAANAAEGSIEAQEATMLGSAQITAAAEAIAADTERTAADAEVVKDRDEKLKLARERQNEERQRKIEELKAQAEAAQRYREQKEEERRRRIEEIRTRDTEKRHQVEERKRAIMEAEKERREYIIRKNQERENRFEVKKRERNSIGFAFGSSTPRLLEPTDFGMVSPSTFWGQRRSTSISNVAGASLSRRSSERELADSATKKRATSASGTDRNDDHRRKSSSMYEVFNWGYTNDEPPKRYSLSIVGAEINIDEPAAATITAAAGVNSNSSHNYSSPSSNNNSFYAHRHYSNHYQGTPPGHNAASAKEENIDASHIVFRSVARRKTDLMPTIPSPRDGHYGSRSSLSNTPRTPGRAYSMNRLDQLAQPIRRNGEHIRSVLERERREHMEMLDETESLGGGRRFGGRSKKTIGVGHGHGPGHGHGYGHGGVSASVNNTSTAGYASSAAKSVSMSHLAGHALGHGLGAHRSNKYSLGGGISSNFRPLGYACKSMTQLNASWSNTMPQPQATPNTTRTQPTPPLPRSNLGLQTAATKKYLQSSLASASASNTTKRGQPATNFINTTTTNPHHRFDPTSLLLMSNSSFLVTAVGTSSGSRSGNVTPGGSISTSRPGSAMSTSTTMSTSGFVQRRAVPAMRKPRPASIAGTGVSLEEMNKLRREQKPPLKTATPLASAQTTPKRNVNLMSTSLIVTSTSSRLASGERKTPTKRESVTPKSSSTPKSLPRTASSERLHKVSREKLKEPSAMSKSALFMTPQLSTTANNVVSSVVVSAAPPAAEEPKKASGAASADAAADITKEEKNVSNSSVMAEEQTANHAVAAEGSPLPMSEVTATNDGDSPHAEKADDGNEKTVGAQQQTSAVVVSSVQKSTAHNGVELMPSAAASEGAADLMTASMIAKSKITTEEEAKAALAERRRLAREEAERQAELERLRVDAEMLAEMKRQEEEAERQRQFEEESTRLAEQQRRAEDERLRQAIEEAKLREEEERRKREDDERQRIEREEADKKAKEEAEKQRLEVAERLKREEKEREERRKRVEAIMSRTRKGGGATNTPNSTPVKENNDSAKKSPNDAEATSQSQGAPESQQQQLLQSVANSSESGSTSGSTTEATTPTPPAATKTPAVAVGAIEPQNTQAMYEQSVIDKEMALINSFSNMIMDENAKNLQQLPTQIVEVANGKMLNDIGFPINAANNEALTNAVSNGNGHIANINNKNDINLLQDVVVPATNQLIDLSIDSQDMNINNAISYDNNNSLLATTTTATGTPTAIATNTLVTADSHENKDISLL